jgi:hypothetical protein
MRATQMDMIIGTAGYNDGVFLTPPWHAGEDDLSFEHRAICNIFPSQ